MDDNLAAFLTKVFVALYGLGVIMMLRAISLTLTGILDKLRAGLVLHVNPDVEKKP